MASDSLYSLIQSLNKAELRYFRLFVKHQSGNKKYLLLFNYLLKLKSYDVDLIKAHFKGEPFLKQFHVAKDYLYKLILKSLRNYHHQHSVDGRLKDILRDIEILYHKELFDQCEKQLKKGIKLARHYEKTLALVEFYGWNRKVLTGKYGTQASFQSVLKLVQETGQLIRQLEHTNQYMDLAMNLFDLINSKGEAALMDHPYIANPEHADTIASKILYHHILYAYAAIVPDGGDKAIQNIDELIELLESRPHMIKEDPTPYLTVLNNKIGAYLFSKQLDKIPAVLEKIRSVPAQYGFREHSKISILSRLKTYNVELELYRDSGNVKQGLKLIPKIQSYINTFPELIPGEYQILFYFQFAYFFFIAGDYSSSLKWINMIMNTNFGTIREDIQSYGRFLNLMIHFELKNIFVLKYSVESCRRFLRKKRNLMAFEKILLNFFSRLSNAPVSHYKDLFLKLEKELFAETSEEEKRNILDYINFNSWITSHLKGAQVTT